MRKKTYLCLSFNLCNVTVKKGKGQLSGCSVGGSGGGDIIGAIVAKTKQSTEKETEKKQYIGPFSCHSVVH